ncbi:polymeric immunoglobulin receptor-like isoform X2 [Acanthopagrus latus]|uniref:polymeric immunoglobulin receptor-like isoform X2 n=1 Tax=Acanthopagrus latus TaxID=8177 RepID=UPI00187C1792|nr:polymeric immunoglobulin receptor-like isoform X2 [Acanthopagrus latus]
MAVHLRILVILTALTGIHSVTTVSEVSVKAGGSISIPCLYEPRYRNNVKYLCKGSSWTSCSYVVKTNTQSSGRFSISDDKTQRIVTVTMKNLKEQDTGYYWCAVEINNGGDDRQYFHLSVTRDTPALNVDHQEIQGLIGEEITIKCHYSKHGVIKWCRLGRNCVTEPSGSIDGTEVIIDKRIPNVFTVTMSGLRTENSGWYWCDKGGFQMPVHLTVTEKPTTTTVAATTLLTTTEPENPPTGSVDEETTTAQSEEQSASVSPRTLIILLSLLIFIAFVTMFIWFMLKKHKQARAAASATTASCTESNVDVVYSSVVFNKPKGLQKTSYTQSDVEVMYSSVALKKPKSVLKVEANDDSVTSGTLV